MTQAQLEQTPGYQFTKQQGLQAVQNSAAARGLGISGASMRGAADYATGLANRTYKDQFNLQQQRFADVVNLNTVQQGNLSNQFGRLYQTAALGENAGAATGTAGTAAAPHQGNFLQTAGQTQGAGITGIGSAANQGIGNYLGYNAFQNYTNAIAQKGGALGYAPTVNQNPGGNLPAG